MGEQKISITKKHFWFKISSISDFENYRGIHQGVGVDIFHYDKCKIAEFTDAKLKSSNIPELSLHHFKTLFIELETLGPIKHLAVKEEPKKVEKEKKKTKAEQMEDFRRDINEFESMDEDIIKLLDNLNPERFDLYSSWLIIGWIFINEGWDMKLFDEYSQKSEKYNKNNNEKILKNCKPNYKGYRIATLYKWLKEDNFEVFKELQNRRKDMWKLITDSNHHSWAEYYYNLVPNKYVCDSKKNWYEYNSNNILIKQQGIPASLLNDVSKRLQEAVKEQEQYIDDNDKNKLMKINAIRVIFITLGTATFIKGIIDFLHDIYMVYRLDEMLDSNPLLLCHDNLVFDLSLNSFRDIRPSDFITKTTKYDVVPTSNKNVRKLVTDFLWSIFENQEMVDYWLTTTSLTLFSTKLQSVFFHSGTGGNGKGLLCSLLRKALGEYHYSAENTFLSSSVKAGAPNPTLADCRGVRYLSVSEPENKTDSTELNIDLIKTLTGGDVVTCRQMYGSNFSYIPQFTIHAQCNAKPKLPKVDEALKRRIKVLDHPFKFVDEPTQPKERKRNYNLDQMINQEFVNEFFILLTEYAVKYKSYDPSKLPTPKQVTDEIDEYLNDNNPVKFWLSRCFEITANENDRIKTSEILQMYNTDPENNGIKMSASKMLEAMKYNGVTAKKSHGIMVYTNIKFIDNQEENEEQNQEDNEYRFDANFGF